MRTVWHSLAWKEWHEHKWKLASIVAIMSSVSLPLLLRNEVDRFGLAAGMLLLAAILLSVFVGLGAAASERSRGTVAFLQALPVPIWRVALLKLVYGLATVIAPIVLAMGLLYVCRQIFDHRVLEREVPLFRTGNWFLHNFLLISMIAASVFIWSAAAGVNRKDEVSAGAVALGAMVGWTTLLALLVEKAWVLGESLPLKAALLSTAPMGPVIANMILGNGWKVHYLELALAVAAITHLALVAWYLVRFGRIANADVRSPQLALPLAGRPDWLAPPRRSWLSAIVWKQFRESGPIVAAGLAGVVGVVAFVGLTDAPNYDVFDFGRTLTATAVYLGFAAALVVGVGVFLNDLTPQINTFWRSRPIDPNGWFWVKLVSGWLVLILSFSVPLTVAGIIFWTELGRVTADWQAAFFVLVPLAMYTSAVAMSCVVRQAVYAAIFSLPVFYSGVVVVWLVKQIATLVGISDGRFQQLVELSAAEVAAGFVVGIVGCTILAWLAVRNDWGWRSRY